MDKGEKFNDSIFLGEICQPLVSIAGIIQHKSCRWEMGEGAGRAKLGIRHQWESEAK